jgi:heme iron utilization protein
MDDFELKEAKVVDPGKLKEQLKGLFPTQPLAALSTYGDGQPYCNLVAFASSEDLRHLIFATTRETRKYANIKGVSQVAMLIDNRSNQVSGYHETLVVTVIGKAKEVKAKGKEDFLKIYLGKHPNLKDFVMSPTCALMTVEVDTYIIALRFQHVMVLSMKK